MSEILKGTKATFMIKLLFLGPMCKTYMQTLTVWCWHLIDLKKRGNLWKKSLWCFAMLPALFSKEDKTDTSSF